MSAVSKPPKLLLGPLTGRIYIATRYTERENGVIEAREKFDVTNDFLNLYTDATAKFDYTPAPAATQEDET